MAGLNLIIRRMYVERCTFPIQTRRLLPLTKTAGSTNQNTIEGGTGQRRSTHSERRLAPVCQPDLSRRLFS
jgi:hypothetical protein